MQALQFPRGNIYQIISQDGLQAIRVQVNNPKQYDGARIVGVESNVNDLGQLWMIEKVGSGDDQYEIVNLQTNYVWTEDSSEIKLKFGKQKNSQLYSVEKIGNAFWFKTTAKGDQALALEGVLRYKAFDPNALNQLFHIVPVNHSEPLNNTCILINARSGKAIDIPEATHEHGVKLIQWEKNKRFNQRWKWVKQGNGYLLQSMLNGQVIDIAEEKKDAGSKVVQWDKTGASNQQWRPVQAGQGLWRIESIHAPGQFLAIHGDDIDDGARVEINNKGETLVWKIEGFTP